MFRLEIFEPRILLSADGIDADPPEADLVGEPGAIVEGIDPAAGAGAAAPTIVWDGSTDGDGDGVSWHDPLNWDLDRVPGAGDDVGLDTGGATVVHSTGTTRVESLAGDGALRLSGSVLEVATTLDLGGGVTLDGGTLADAAVGAATVVAATRSTHNRLSGVTTAGDVDLSADFSYLRIRGGLELAGGTVHLSGNLAGLGIEGSQSITGTGTVAIEGSGSSPVQIEAVAASTLVIEPGITLRGGHGVVGGGRVSGSALALVNRGTILADLNGQVLEIDGRGGGSFTNEGVVEASGGGRLRIISSSSLNVTTITVTDSTLTLGGSWENDGMITAAGSTVNLGGEFTLADLGSFERSGGAVFVTGTLENTGTTLVLDADTGQWVLNGGTIRGGTVELRDGLLLTPTTSPGSRLEGVRVVGDVDLSADFSYLRIRGGLELAGGTVHLSGNLAGLGIEGSQSITGTGTVAIEGSGSSPVQIEAVAASTLVIEPGITLRGGHGVVGGGRVSGSALALVNRGTILADLNGQVLEIDGRGGGSFTNEGVVEASGGGRLRTRTITNSGMLSVLPGGVVTVDGNLEQTAAAMVAVRIAGSAADQFGRVAVTRSAGLDGSFSVRFTGGFRPLAGDSFTPLTFSSSTGKFVTFMGLEADGIGLDAVLGPTSLRLDVVFAGEPDAEQTRRALLDGIDQLLAALPDWADLFGLDAAGADGLELPLLPRGLDDLFDVRGALRGLTRPQVGSVSSHAELVEALGAVGLEVLCVIGGAGGLPGCDDPADRVVVRWAPTTTRLSGTTTLDPAAIALLPDLPPPAALEGSLEWTADLIADLVVGVGADGAFVSGESALALVIGGGGSVSGSFPLAGALSVEAGGTASSDANDPLSLRLAAGGPAARFTPDTPAADVLTAVVDGAAAIELGLTLAPFELSWTGSWSLPIVGGSVEPSGTVEFPTPDELIDAFLRSFPRLVEPFFGGELLDLLASIPIPLAGGAGPLAPPGDDGVVRDLDEPFWFESLLGRIENVFQWDLDSEDGEFFLPAGQGVHYTLGDALLGASALRNTLGLDGAGVTIGVISDGVRGLAKAQRGRHPEITPGKVTVHPVFRGGRIGGKGGAEGTAMIEIIHDIAPGADVLFAGVGGRKVDSRNAFIEGIRWFVEQGAQVIVDDIGFFGEPVFFGGRVAAAVEQLLRENDILFISAAGNDNGFHHQAPLNLAAHFDGELSDTVFYHDFREGSRHVEVSLPAKETLRVYLQWSGDTTGGDFYDPRSSFENLIYNFTLALVDGDGVVKVEDRDTGWPDRKRAPSRSIAFTNTERTPVTMRIVLGASEVPEDPALAAALGLDLTPEIELFVTGAGVGAANTPFDQIFGHPAVSGVLTVGAIDVEDPGFDTPESFTSGGPSTVRNDILNTLEVRNSLDVMAADGVSVSGAGGFLAGSDRFRGTSAAAPHVAGVAALLLQHAGGRAGPGDVREAIIDSAVDLSMDPVAIADLAVSVDAGDVVIEVLANDLDLDALLLGDGSGRAPLALESVEEVTAGPLPTLGKVRRVGDTAVYTPPADVTIDASGTREVFVDSFQYIVRDADGSRAAGTVRVLVGLERRPVAVADGAIVVPPAGEVIIDVLQNDFDPDGDAIHIARFDAVSKNGGDVLPGPTPGTLRYVAHVLDFPDDSFEYVVSDGANETTATVTVHTPSPEDVPSFTPVALADIVRLDSRSGRSVTIDLLANDVNPNGLTIGSLEKLGDVETAFDILRIGSVIEVTPTAEAEHGRYTVYYHYAGAPVQGELEVLVDDSRLPHSTADAAAVVLGSVEEIRLAVLDNDVNVDAPSIASPAALADDPFFAIDGAEIVFTATSALAAADTYNAATPDFFVVRPGASITADSGGSGVYDLRPPAVLVIRPGGRRLADPASSDEAERRGYDHATGFGRVNARAAADLLDERFPAPAEPAGGGSAETRVEVSLLEVLEDFGVTVGSALDAAAITDLLSGRATSIGELLRLRYRMNPEDDGVASAAFEFDAAGVGALADARLAGSLDAELQPFFELELGFDAGGFFLGSGTSLDARILADVEASGAFAGLTASARGTVSLDVGVALLPLDADRDGALRIDEFLSNLGALEFTLSNVAADLTVELSSDLLDSVDADGDPTNNSSHGGDPFRFAVATSATLDLAGGFAWNGFEVLNPDVDRDGVEDFTTAVLVEDVRLLARDVLRGERTLLGDELLAAFGVESVPLFDSSLAGVFDVAGAFAAAVLDATEVLAVVDFETIASWLDGGVPAEAQEIIRLRVDLGSIALGVLPEAGFDLALLDGVFPGLAAGDGRAGIRNATLSGELVLGFDTSPDSFYVLVAPDAVRPDAVTSLGGGFELFVDLQGATSLGGVLELEDGSAVLAPEIIVELGAADGKLRLLRLEEASISVVLGGASALTVTAGRVALASGGGSIVASAEGLRGEFELATGVLDVTADAVGLDVAGAVELSAADVRLVLDPGAPGDATVATLRDVTGTIPVLAVPAGAPSVRIPEIRLRRDGRLFVDGEAVLALPEDYLNGFGLGELVPFEIGAVRVAFPDAGDLSRVTVSVTGVLELAELKARIDSLLGPGSDVGVIVHIGDPAAIDAGGAGVETFSLADNAPFELELSVSALAGGVLRPATIGPITVGLSGVVAGGITFDGRITLGGYRDGVFDGAVDGFLEVVATEGGDASAADYLGARLEVLPGSSITAGASGATIDLELEAVLSGIIQEEGGGVAVDGTSIRLSLLAGTTHHAGPPFVVVDRFDLRFESFSVGELVFEIQNVVRFTGRRFDYVPEPRADGVIASIEDADVEFLHPDLRTLTARAGGILLADDPAVAGDRRVELGTLAISAGGVLGDGGRPVLEFEGLEIRTTDLVFNLDVAAITAGTLELGATRAALLPDLETPAVDGVAIATGLTFTLDTASGGFTIHAATFTASLGGLIEVSTTGIAIDFNGGPFVFELAGTTTATFPALEVDGLGPSVILEDVGLRRDGTWSLGGVAVSIPAEYQIAVAEFLPFTVTSVALDFGDPVDLDRFDLAVTGRFRIEERGPDSLLPFTPEIIIGDPAGAVRHTLAQNGSVTLDIAVESLRRGRIGLRSFGPITLGFGDWQVGELTLAGRITFGEFGADGTLNALPGKPQVFGFVELVAAGDVQPLADEPDLADFAPPDDPLDVPGAGVDPFALEGGRLEIGGALSVEDGVATVRLDFAADLDLRLRLGSVFELFGIGFDTSVVVTNHAGRLAPEFDIALSELRVDGVRVTLGDVLRFTARDVRIDFDPAPGDPLARFGAMSVRFPGLDGIGGVVRDLAILPGGVPDVFGRAGTAPDFELAFGDSLDGIFEWLPIRVDELGIRFNPGFLSADGRLLDPLDFALLFSGGLEDAPLPALDGNGGESGFRWPITATIEDLELDVGALRRGEFPIENIEGVEIFIDPSDLLEGTGFVVRGGLGFGRSTVGADSVLYVRLAGDFRFKEIGAGIELIIGERGPVLGKVLAPLGIPLGPTGILLQAVEGGVVFGGPELRSVDEPIELVTDATFFDGVLSLSTEDVAAALERVLADGGVTWDRSFSIALTGILTTVASPGILTADVTLAANAVFGGENAGLRLLGAGEASLWGFPLGRAGLLVDFADPLAPDLSFAFATPAPGSPLGLIFPANVELTVSVDTEGLVAAPLVGLRAVAARLAGPGAEVLASRLEADHGRPLAIALLDLDGDGAVSATEDARAIDRAFVESRLLGGLPDGFDDVVGLTPVELRQAVRLGQAFIQEVVLFAGDLVSGSLDVETLAATIQTAVADAARAGLADFNRAFDPSISIHGVVQPTIFGFPLGAPTDEADVHIGRDGISFTLSTNITANLKRIADIIGPAGVGRAIIDLITLGVETRLHFGFGLEFPEEIVDVILTGAPPEGSGFTTTLDYLVDVVNPFSGWEVLIGGDLLFMGFEFASVSGLLFGPDPGPQSLFANLVEDPRDPSTRGEGRIPVTSTAHHDAMRLHGGLLLTGELFLPAVLKDPVRVLTQEGFWDLPDLSNPLQVVDALGGWVDRILHGDPREGTVGLLSQQTWAEIQLYVPSPARLFGLAFGGENAGRYLDHDSESGGAETLERDADADGEFDPPRRVDGATPPGALLFADLNDNGIYDPRIDVVIDRAAGRAFGDADGDLAFNAARGDALVDLGAFAGLAGELTPAIAGVAYYELVDVFSDAGNGVFDPLTEHRDTNGNGRPDPGDTFIDRSEGFVDRNGNGRFDLGADELLDRDGDGLPDGELFIDSDGDGVFDGEGAHNPAGEAFIDLGNGALDRGGSRPRVEPVPIDAATAAIFDAAYFEGFADVQLLSMRLGGATVAISSSGLEVAMSAPLLAGLTASFGVGYRMLDAGALLADLLVSPLVRGAAPPALVDFIADVDLSLPFPVASFTTEVGSEHVENWIAESLLRVPGLAAPRGIFTSNGGAVRFEAYTPGASDDPAGVGRRGGFRLEADLDFVGFIEDARYAFEMELFAGDAADLLFPRFTARAEVESLAAGLDTARGVLALDGPSEGQRAMLEVRKKDGAVTGSLAGRVRLLDTLVLEIDGGFEIVRDATSGRLGVVAELELGGGVTRQLSRPGYALAAGFSLQVNTTARGQLLQRPGGGTVAIPRGLRIHAEGFLQATESFRLDGAFDLRVADERLSVTAAASVDVFGISMTASGGFTIAPSGLALDLVLRLGGSTAITITGGSFELDGSFRLRIDTAASTSAVAVSGARLRLLDAFDLHGSLSIRVEGGDFVVDVPANAPLTLDLFESAFIFALHGRLDSTGSYDFTASGSLGTDPADPVGYVSGDLSIRLASDLAAGESIASFSGAGVLFGVPLASVDGELDAGGCLRVQGAFLGVEYGAEFGLRSDACVPIFTFRGDGPVGTESNTGMTTTVRVHVFRAGNVGVDASVRVRTVSIGEATPGSDFVSVDRVLHFAAGMQSQVVSVTIRGDTEEEPEERFRLVLSEPVDEESEAPGQLIRSEITVTIVDDDTPPPATPPADTIVFYDFVVGDGAFSVAPTAVPFSAATATVARVFSETQFSVLFGPFEHAPQSIAGNPDRALSNTGWRFDPPSLHLPGGITVTPFFAFSKYFEFRVSPAPGFALRPQELTFDARAFGGGPDRFEVRTSLDGFGTAIGSGDLGAGFGSHTVAFPEDVCQLDTLTVRIFGLGAASEAGTFAIDNLALRGGTPLALTCFVSPGVTTVGSDLTVAVPGGLEIESELVLGGGLVLQVQEPITIVNNATVTMAPGVMLAVEGAGVENGAGGTMQGSGIINVIDTPTQTITNRGHMKPGFSPGVLTVAGNLAQAATGVIEIEIGGSEPGRQHDVLAVTGHATLGGTLRIETLEGFEPEPGPWEILTFASSSGEFDVVEGLVINDHLAFELVITDISVLLVLQSPRLITTSLETTVSGFELGFNRSLDLDALDVADVVLAGALGGVVPGSLVVSPDARSFAFVATGGPLRPDTYTLRLSGAADGLRDEAREPLDGDYDGVAGGDLELTFAVDRSRARLVSLADVVRGPLQEVELPVILSDGRRVNRVELTLLHDPELLELLDVLPGAGLPDGSVVVTDGSAAGRLDVAITTPVPLAAGPIDLLRLVTGVPDDAPYGAVHLLELIGVSLNGGAIDALGDAAVHLVAYPGDVTGNGEHSALDAQRIARVAVGLDSIFGALPRVDPLLVGDVTGNGAISALDATRVLQQVVGLESDAIPPIPRVAVAALRGTSGAAAEEAPASAPDGAASRMRAAPISVESGDHLVDRAVELDFEPLVARELGPARVESRDLHQGGVEVGDVVGALLGVESDLASGAVSDAAAGERRVILPQLGLRIQDARGPVAVHALDEAHAALDDAPRGGLSRTAREWTFPWRAVLRALLSVPSDRGGSSDSRHAVIGATPEPASPGTRRTACVLPGRCLGLPEIGRLHE